MSNINIRYQRLITLTINVLGGIGEVISVVLGPPDALAVPNVVIA